MYITRVVIKNYRRFKDSTIELNDKINIVVGDNECGKSTLLEAINLALTWQLNGRAIQSGLHPYLFNEYAVNGYIASLVAKKPVIPPSILIEVYFNDDPALVNLKGTNNSLRDDVPGISLSIDYNPEYNTEYEAYIAIPERIRTVPVEYYKATWRNFTGNDITSRSIPIKPSFIDASTIRNDFAANRYVIDIVKSSLDKKQQAELSLSYRMMKDSFLDDSNVKAINDTLAAKKSNISDKAVSLSLDTSSRASWESGIVPHLDDIPMPLVGKGEQNSVKIKLAMESADESHLFLIEEPENHLSFSNLNVLIKCIADRKTGKQLIITTHSSFVLNKLGVESVLLFRNGKSITLKHLSKDTHDYFIKLPGHETLRMILAQRVILVEGPSDELIVQKAFHKMHGKMPLEMGVDVITVNSLAFKRFLEIAEKLGVQVDVITDNDGKVAQLQSKYEDYLGAKAKDHIKIQFDGDEQFPTLEPQLLKANDRATLNDVLGTTYATDESLLAHMQANKTECALKFFETEIAWTVPEYINRAL
jgi:putative ATP-dependent endonuclease of OLD family